MTLLTGLDHELDGLTLYLDVLTSLAGSDLGQGFREFMNGGQHMLDGSGAGQKGDCWSKGIHRCLWRMVNGYFVSLEPIQLHFVRVSNQF